MKEIIAGLIPLFEEAKQKNEFDFIFTLINYTQIGAKELSSNLHEWFEVIDFYKEQFNSLLGSLSTQN